MYPTFFTLPDWIPWLGGAPITSFGVFMFLAFLVGGHLLRAEMGRVGLERDKAWDILFMAVVGGILGAKIYYVFLNWPLLVADPMGMIFSRGGMVWYGGFIGAAILILWEVRRSSLPLQTMMDVTAAPLSLSYAVGRIGCFLVGDDYGRPTDSWVGIRFPNGTPPTTVNALENHFGITVNPELVERFGQVVPVHPTQLYEIAMSTLIFLVLWKMRGHRHGGGWLWWVWMILAGSERFIVEFVRVKDDRFLGPLTIAQVLSLGLIAWGIWGVRKSRAPQEAAGKVV